MCQVIAHARSLSSRHIAKAMALNGDGFESDCISYDARQVCCVLNVAWHSVQIVHMLTISCQCKAMMIHCSMSLATYNSYILTATLRRQRRTCGKGSRDDHHHRGG